MTPATLVLPRLAAPVAAPSLAAPAERWGPWLLMLCGFSLGGSAFGSARLSLGGFLVHPIVVLAGLMFPALWVKRSHVVPRQLVIAMVLFVASYAVAMLSWSGFYHQPVVKLASTMVIILVACLLVRSERSYLHGVFGLLLGVTVMALYGIAAGGVGEETFSPLKDASGNKNAFSLYALPAMLLSGEAIIRRRGSLAIRAMMAAGWVTLALTIFLSANRSGWGGVVFVVAAILLNSARRRFMTLVTLAAATAVTYFVMITWFDTGVFERRFAQTVEGYESDTLRRNLFIECFRIGLESPLWGVGPQLDQLLAQRLRFSHAVLGPHNALTALFGIGGLMVVGAWFNLGRQFWKAGKLLTSTLGKISLMHLLIGLWIFRAGFTDEALYSPSFAMAFGLLLGAGLMVQGWRGERGR